VSRASLRWVPRLATPAWLLVAVSALAVLLVEAAAPRRTSEGTARR